MLRVCVRGLASRARSAAAKGAAGEVKPTEAAAAAAAAATAQPAAPDIEQSFFTSSWFVRRDDGSEDVIRLTEKSQATRSVEAAPDGGQRFTLARSPTDATITIAHSDPMGDLTERTWKWSPQARDWVSGGQEAAKPLAAGAGAAAAPAVEGKAAAKPLA